MVAPDMDPDGPAYVNTARLWAGGAGGAATAVVAALAVVAGVLIARGVLGIPEARGRQLPLGVAMTIVLVAVLMLAASIWIAIRMEAGLDAPAIRAVDQVHGLRSCGLHCARMTVGHTYPVRKIMA